MQFPSAGGGIHYGNYDSQEGVRHFVKAVTEAARYKIAVDTHEPVKDTGLRRTYPNWLSREGARGVEYNAWGNPVNPVDHEVKLVFTRMLSGPMDYTPGVLSLVGADNKAMRRDVKLGTSTPAVAAVTSGLKAGELIVTEGVQRVKSGAAVTPQLPTPPPTDPKSPTPATP